MAVPVMKLDASDARNSAAAAISAGVARRLSACRFSTKARASGVGVLARPMGVSVPPGSRALARRPRGPYSAAMTWVRPTRQSEEHTSELQSPHHLVSRLLLQKKKT